jgi:Ras-related protein Rab-1A
LTRFADDQFTENYVTTIGVDFRFKTMIVMDKIVKVQVWDTAGQERYRSITNAYYRGAEGILIVFDVTNKESFKNIENWIKEVTVFTGNDVVIVSLGNKSDLKKSITKSDIDDFKKRTKLEIFNVSAKTGEGVEDAFKHIIELLIKKNLEKKETNVINLNPETNKSQAPTNKKNDSCC